MEYLNNENNNVLAKTFALLSIIGLVTTGYFIVFAILLFISLIVDDRK